MRTNFAFLFVVAFALMTSCRQNKMAFDREKTSQEMKDMLMAYGAALESADAQKTISFFNDSPDFFVHTESRNYTYDELMKEIPDWFVTKDTRKLRIVWNKINFTVLDESSAICYAELDEIETDRNDKETHPIKIAVSVTFGGIKEDNQWKIAYAHSIHTVTMDSTAAPIPK